MDHHDEARPAISVVICSFNGARTLRRCLEAVERQSIRAEAQVIVVDDGSLDATSEIAREFNVELVVHPRNLGISRARNSGVRAARADIVAFTDDDCVPSATWLEMLLAGYRRAEVAAVGGAIEVDRVETFIHRFLVDNNPLAPLELELSDHRRLPARLVLYVRRMWSRAPPSHARAVYSFAGANMSFLRSVLDEVGGFDERMTFGADDEYVCSQIRERRPDLALWLAPEAIVRHDFAGTFRDLFRRNYAYGRGHARSYILEPSRGWPIVFPVPIAALVALILLRRSRAVVLVPLLLPLLLPQGVLAVQRTRRPTDLAFSYLRLAEEFAHNAGMLAGLVHMATTGTGRRRGQ